MYNNTREGSLVVDQEILFSVIIDNSATPPTLLCCKELKNNSSLRKAEFTYSQQANYLGKPSLSWNDDKE